MSEAQFIPLSNFKIEPSLDDLFWQEKIKRAIKETDSRAQLKEIATMLVEISIKRQAVVRALINDMFELHGIQISDANMESVPDLEK